MGEERVINRGVDTLVLNGYYTDERDKPVKRELDEQLVDNGFSLRCQFRCLTGRFQECVTVSISLLTLLILYDMISRNSDNLNV